MVMYFLSDRKISFLVQITNPYQDESNGTSFILSSSFYKLKNNFYYFLKIENILTDSLLVKYLFLINEVPFDSSWWGLSNGI